jgi:hypothetical protein
MCDSLCWWAEVLKILPTFIVGLIAARIAWQQSATAMEQRRISQAKLNLDLFDRRLAIFNATWGRASAVLNTDKPMLAPPDMTNRYAEASFLFGPEVEEFMKQLATTMTSLAMAREHLKSPKMLYDHDPEVKAENEKAKSDLMIHETWIREAATSGIRKVVPAPIVWTRFCTSGGLL